MADLSHKYRLLSPFELKNELTRLAASRAERAMLNAGRGNPNFLATLPRAAFFCLGEFAVTESTMSYSYLSSGVGGQARIKGIEERFKQFLHANAGREGVSFLARSLSFVRDQMGLDADRFVQELVEGILGCFYPGPPRMLKNAETIVGQYLMQEMGGVASAADNVDLFATEGGTAAMAYIFQTLFTNGVLKKGDKIALGEPIFTPYIEIPALEEFGLEIVTIVSDRESNWQFSAAELDKLQDPAIKIFFCVNPANPASVKMDDVSLEHLSNLVNTVRKDLIILTDDVYGTFADGFRSLFTICPYNTILVYSFSKYFGATGWRLGVIATHKQNVVDALIAAQDPDQHEAQNERYESLTTDPKALRFIDRIVADCRSVALNHTSGLSTPQQVQMMLFALSTLMDREDTYRKTVKKIIRHRYNTLYAEIGIVPDESADVVCYYSLIDLIEVAKKTFGAEFAGWMAKNVDIIEFLFRIAEDSGVVLLPGQGFGTTAPFVRISLANLNDYQYRDIGQSVRRLVGTYHESWQANVAAPS